MPTHGCVIFEMFVTKCGLVLEIDIDLLISAVEARPVLWDKTLETFKNVDLTRTAWAEVCKDLKSDFEDVEEEEKNAFSKEVMKRWANIQDLFIKSIKRQKNAAKCGTEASRINKYIYNDQLRFLKKIYEVRIGCLTKDGQTEDMEKPEKEAPELQHNVVEEIIETQKESGSKKRKLDVVELLNIKEEPTKHDHNGVELLIEAPKELGSQKRKDEVEKRKPQEGPSDPKQNGAEQRKKWPVDVGFQQRKEEIEKRRPRERPFEQEHNGVEQPQTPIEVRSRTHKDNVEQINPHDRTSDDEQNVVGQLPVQRTQTDQRSQKQKIKLDKVELKMLQALEELPDRHLSFFNSIIPSLDNFNDVDIIQFQLEVLQVIADIKQQKRMQSVPSAYMIPQQLPIQHPYMLNAPSPPAYMIHQQLPIQHRYMHNAPAPPANMTQQQLPNQQKRKRKAPSPAISIYSSTDDSVDFAF